MRGIDGDGGRLEGRKGRNPRGIPNGEGAVSMNLVAKT